MKANKIGHVHLNVRNLENAERFYTEVFGFRVTERIRDTFVFLSLGDHHHDLALRNVGANAPIPPDLSVGMYHFAIEVENRKILAPLPATFPKNWIPFHRKAGCQHKYKDS